MSKNFKKKFCHFFPSVGHGISLRTAILNCYRKLAQWTHSGNRFTPIADEEHPGRFMPLGFMPHASCLYSKERVAQNAKQHGIMRRSKKETEQPITQNLCPSADTGLMFALIFFSRSGDISFTP